MGSFIYTYDNTWDLSFEISKTPEKDNLNNYKLCLEVSDQGFDVLQNQTIII